MRQNLKASIPVSWVDRGRKIVGERLSCPVDNVALRSRENDPGRTDKPSAGRGFDGFVAG